MDIDGWILTVGTTGSRGGTLHIALITVDIQEQ